MMTGQYDGKSPTVYVINLYSLHKGNKSDVSTTLMLFNDFATATAWGEPEQQSGDIVKDAIKKEQILKSVSL